jgi:hypothetical protein
MKALTRISIVACIIYVSIVFVIYKKTHSDALEQSRNLQLVEASVLSTERCPGKSLCYFTVAEYKIDGVSVRAKVLGEIGDQGKNFLLLVTPGNEKGFLSHNSYIKQASSFLPFLFLPLGVFLFPLILAITDNHNKPEHNAKNDRSKA